MSRIEVKTEMRLTSPSHRTHIDEEKKRKFKLRDILVSSLLMYYKVTYTLRYINSVKTTLDIFTDFMKTIKKGKTKTSQGKIMNILRLHCQCYSLNTRAGTMSNVKIEVKTQKG